MNVNQGDIGSLLSFLETQGVEAADRAELEAAVRDDEGSFGPRVKAWLGAAVAKATTVGSAVAEKATTVVITAAVLRYDGLG